ncbi:UNVERIFIED_CONTAM: hypothetical protein PYX00_010741 [Menopon gallinae]|uniref:Carboxylesterase type B domain-containing protein n=2 Tax=Menopon gallinae TaxID=328185 RepID=A0AAW2HGN4_9NEOP
MLDIYGTSKITTVLNKNMIKLIYLVVSINNIYCQHIYGGYQNPYTQKNGDQHFVRLNPGDRDYQTFEYNGRRYGQSFPEYDPRYYDNRHPSFNNPNYPENRRYNPDFNPNDPTVRFSDTSGIFSKPGVVGGWRDDLQGKQRPDYMQLQQNRDIFVTTSYGQVQGFRVHVYDNPDPYSQYRPGLTPVETIKGNVSVFLGIPYAMPPVRERRFMPPQIHKGWQLIQAVDFGPACPQPVKYVGAEKGIRDMHEDCLYLNIYSPYTGTGIAQKYAVMFYIHGGDFYKGASNTFPAHMLAAFYDVVVVTINYRLGALGFLSTADENSPGNYGIMDQAMALKWVYDNIEYFNGDKNSITLFGPGAGAASAGLLMVAPTTRHMVNKVIAQSGSALADWAVIQNWERVQNTSKVYGRHLGCPVDSSWKLVSCLRSGRSAFELGNAEFRPEIGFFAWGPVLDANFSVPRDSWFRDTWSEKDWHFLPATPEELIKESRFNPELKYMAGVTTQEAANMIYNNVSLAPYFEINDRFFDQKVRELVLQYNYTYNQEGVYQAIRYMYTYWPDPLNTTHIREQYIHMLSDFIYRAPTDKIIKLLLNRKVPVYLYVLNTTVEALRLPEWRKFPHDIEHFFLTGAPFMDIEFFPSSLKLKRDMWTENDRNMSHFFMKAYSDFARFGNPSPQQIFDIHFEAARQGEIKYLNINTTFNSSIMYNYRQTEFAFWSSYLPTIIGSFFPLYRPYGDYWWEPKEPLQIAFWSISGVCLLLSVALVMCCILWRNAKRETDRYYGDLIQKDDDECVEGVDNASRSSTNIYEIRDLSATVKRPPTGTPPPVFKSRPTSLSLSQQNIIEEKKPSEQLSRSTGNFLNEDKGKVYLNRNVSMDPNPKIKDSKRSYSTPSLRSNSSKESLRDEEHVRMVPGSKKGIRRNPRILDKVPQTQV